eukprot:1264609-Prymnesium_polylepis.1
MSRSMHRAAARLARRYYCEVPATAVSSSPWLAKTARRNIAHVSLTSSPCIRSDAGRFRLAPPVPAGQPMARSNVSHPCPSRNRYRRLSKT